MPMDQGFRTTSFLVKNLKKQSEWFNHIRTSVLVQTLIPLVIMALFFLQYLLLLSHTTKRESIFQASSDPCSVGISSTPAACLSATLHLVPHF